MNNVYEKYEFVPGKVIAAFNESFTYFNNPILFDFSVNGLEIDGIEILHRRHNQRKGYPGSIAGKADHDIVLLKLKNKTKQAVIEAIGILSQNPDVLYAEPDYLMYLDTIPNDRHFSVLWGMKTIKAPYAWGKFTGSSGVVVGVVDSGIDYRHKDLTDNIWVDQSGESICGWDFFNDDSDPMDKNSHGTHVAGTIGAVGNNGIGVTGVTWNVKMAALKIAGESGAVCASAAVRAVEYAIDKEIPILNNSWGGRVYCESMKSVIEQYDGLFIASSGNSGLDNDIYPHFPSAYDCDNIISVAATCRNDRLAVFSNYGALSVDIAAPGDEIYSSILNNGYGYKSGTSMAAPHVAGAAALLKGYMPDLTALEIKNIILSSAEKIPSLYGKVLTGGELNVSAMFEIAGLL